MSVTRESEWHTSPTELSTYEKDVAEGVISPYPSMQFLTDYLKFIKGSISCKKYQGKWLRVFYEIEFVAKGRNPFSTIITGNDSWNHEEACHETLDSALLLIRKQYPNECMAVDGNRDNHGRAGGDVLQANSQAEYDELLRQLREL